MVELSKRFISQPKLAAVILDFIIPIFLFFSLLDENDFAAWTCLILVIITRMLVAIKG